jgi:hypothetical protein
VSPVKYELGFYIPEDAILHSHRRENIKSYIASCGFQHTDEETKSKNPVFLRYLFGLVEVQVERKNSDEIYGTKSICSS